MTHDSPDDGTESHRDSTDPERRRARGAGGRPWTASSAPLDRRDYLRALGAVGGAGVLGSTAATTATAQSGFDEAAADQRIRENQTGPLTVEVVDQDGNPVSGATVDVEMQEHDFVFGAEVNAGSLVDEFGDGHPYREHLLDLFNAAVLENNHKWAIWAGNQQLADRAVDWLDQHGFDIRGHTCIYPVEYAVPGDVMTAVENGDAQTIRDRTMGQIEEIITHYGDTVMEWDVVNEVLHRGLLHDGVYPGQIDLDDLPAGEIQPWTSQLLADWYSHAESVIDQNGLDVEIVTNDYNTLTWGYARDRYAEQIAHLESQGVDLDAIGLQSHIGPGKDTNDQWTYASLEDVFQHYSQFDAAQRITEFDMAGDSWTGHQQRAEVLEVFLKTAYGHPDVDEFTMWGYWDNRHWLDEAPFFEEDWTEKPALDVYRSLVFDEWWTSATGTTGSDGTYAVDAFLGEHEVTVTTESGSTTQTVSVTDAAGQRLVVSVEGDGGSTPAEPPSVSPVELSGTYRIENVGSGHVLSIEGGSTADGASVVQRSYDGSADQHWTFEHLGDGVHRIDNAGSGASMDVLDAQVGDGADVIQWSWTGGDNQRFLVGEDDDGDLAVVAQHSNRVLDVADQSTAEGANVQQWSDNGGDHQRWTAVPVEGSSECGESTADVDGRTVCDLDGDGLHEDVTGDGQLGQDDVVTFFENQHRSAWQDPGLFDFSENGSVGHGDVVALFEDVVTS